MPLSDANVTLGELQRTVAFFQGIESTQRAFASYLLERGLPVDGARIADTYDMNFAEALLTSATGMALTPLINFLLSKSETMPRDAVLQLVRGLTAEIKGNRNIAYEAILGSPQGIAYFDGDLRLRAWNTGGLTIFNFAEGEIAVGTTLHEFVMLCAQRGFYGPGPVEELAAARLTAILDTSTVKRLRLKNGRSFEMRAVQMPDEGLCLVYMDVTRQAVAEEQLEAENETLERRVRERTEELEHLNAALVKAKAEAEEANISKTRFLAAASHDLLQPMNAARLYATSLKERISTQHVGDHTMMLARNVEDSLEAVEDILTALLDISRLDAGAMRAEITTFRIDDILRQLLLEFEPIASSKGLRLTFVLSSLPISSDRRLLRRLLQNLVSNAIKYTPEGRVIVGVRRRGPWARIEIWDTGIGIPKNKQSEIFREFARLPSAITAAPGVGLGLSIVHRLGRVLGHAVEVRSKPDRGSVFSVKIPRGTGAPAARLSESNKALFNQRSLKGLVIVAIDNEPMILAGMETLLSGWECTVVGGADITRVAAELIRRDLVPDVVIADYHLGETDGIAAIAALRARYGDCHGVLVTADRSTWVRDLTYRADIRLLNKPLKPATLRSLLSQWCLVKPVAG